jgi:hypothetical protein
MNRILSENLYKALKQVKQTKIHKTLHFMNFEKLEFSNGELTITTLDADTFEPSQVKCSCIMEEEWSTCVPMQKKIDVSDTRRPVWHKVYPFMDFIKVVAEYKDVLEFTFDPKIQTLKIKIQGERSVTEFKCIDAQEFPAVNP